MWREAPAYNNNTEDKKRQYWCATLQKRQINHIRVWKCHGVFTHLNKHDSAMGNKEQGCNIFVLLRLQLLAPQLLHDANLVKKLSEKPLTWCVISTFTGSSGSSSTAGAQTLEPGRPNSPCRWSWRRAFNDFPTLKKLFPLYKTKLSKKEKGGEWIRQGDLTVSRGKGTG